MQKLRDHSSLLDDETPPKRILPPDFGKLLSQLSMSPEHDAEIIFRTISSAAFLDPASNPSSESPDLDYCCYSLAQAIISRVKDTNITHEEIERLVETVTALTRIVIHEGANWEFAGTTIREHPQLPGIGPEIHEQYNAGPLVNRFDMEAIDKSPLALHVLNGESVQEELEGDDDVVKRFSELRKSWLSFVRFTALLASRTESPLRDTCIRLGLWAVRGATGTSEDEFHPAKRWPGLAKAEARIWFKTAGNRLKDYADGDEWDRWSQYFSDVKL